MTGPKSLKLVCAKCKVMRWRIENFSGIKCEDVTDTTVCDFCVRDSREASLLARIENLVGSVVRLEGCVERLEGRVETLEGEKKALQAELLSSTRPNVDGVVPVIPSSLEVADAAKTKKKRKKNKKNKMQVQEEEEKKKEEKKKKKEEKKKKKKEEKKQKKEEQKKEEEQKKKKEEQKKKEEEKKRKKQETPKGEAMRVHLVGDSQVRGLQPLLNARLRESTSVRCFPGKGNAFLRKEAEKLPGSSSSVIALCVSGNDMYKRGRKTGTTEEIIQNVMGAVDDCGLKTRKRVLVGMLPRRTNNPVALSKNIAINARL